MRFEGGEERHGWTNARAAIADTYRLRHVSGHGTQFFPDGRGHNVFGPGAPGSWDDDAHRKKHILRDDDGVYYMLYEGFDAGPDSTLGLATVMLRNVLERRSELALLRAVGFRNGSLSGLVLWENTVLLSWGLIAGTASALLAMTPHLTSTGADVPWAAVGWILGGVFLVGTIAALLAVAAAVRTPIVATLRSE